MSRSPRTSLQPDADQKHDRAIMELYILDMPAARVNRLIARILPLVTLLWILTLSVLTGLSRVACGLQGSEDYAQIVLGVWSPTPFYPGSNRVGSLLPLLASGVKDMFWNANLQMILRALAAYAAAHAAARLFGRKLGTSERSSAIPIVGFVTCLLAFTQFSVTGFYVAWISNHSYLVAAAVLLPSMMLLKTQIR